MIRCSICLSTRNKAAALRNTLRSIYAQEVPFTFEVIVVDDGSRDETKAVCDDFPKVRYRFLANPKYRNPSKARNEAFRMAEGEIILAQSDDVVHVGGKSIQTLVDGLKDGEFLLARTANYQYDKQGNPVQFIREYAGPERQVPYFFLGAIRYENVYAVGGYDEEFVEPCFDDDWFGDCLTKGIGLSFRYTEEVIAHHQSHGYEPHSHDNEHVSRALYAKKVEQAKQDGRWVSAAGPWKIETPGIIYKKAEEREDLLVPSDPDQTSDIPNRMHFFWGGASLSFMRFMTLYSFRRHHPDWDVFLCQMPDNMVGDRQWSSTEKMDHDGQQLDDYSDYLQKINVEVTQWEPMHGMPRKLAPSHACDLFEWSMLSTTGGWYADMDILWIGRLPSIQEANAVFCLSDRWVAIGLFASTPGNRLFREVLRTAMRDYAPNKYQSTGAEAIYHLAGTWPNWGEIEDVGPRAFKNLQESYPDVKMVNLPSRCIYPWNWLNIAKIFNGEMQPPEGCRGVHWFGGSQLAQVWNAKLTHANYKQFSNTYTNLLAGIIEDGFFDSPNGGKVHEDRTDHQAATGNQDVPGVPQAGKAGAG